MWIDFQTICSKIPTTDLLPGVQPGQPAGERGPLPDGRRLRLRRLRGAPLLTRLKAPPRRHRHRYQPQNGK